MKGLLKQAVSLLSSLKITVVVLSLLTFIFILGFFLPQKLIVPPEQYSAWKTANPRLVPMLEYLDFTAIYTAPLTRVLFGIFFVNLTVVFLRRVSLIIKRTSLPSPSGVDPGLLTDHSPGVISVPGGEDLLCSVIAALKKKRFRVIREGERFIALKNRYSAFCTIGFHLCFFLFLLGALAGFYTKFSGKLILAEGETFTGALAQYSSASLPKAGEAPLLRFQVMAIRPLTIKGRASALYVDILMEDGQKKTVNINQPLKQGDVSFVVKNMGIAPLFVLRDLEGNEIAGAYFKLAALIKGTDTFTLGGYRIDVIFYPDYSAKDREALSEKRFAPVLSDPVFEITARKDGGKVYHGTARKGEPVMLNGMNISFDEIPYWVEFYVSEDKGVVLIYAGFVLGIVSLLLRFGFPRKEVMGGIVEGRIYLKGKSDFYQLQFQEELEALMKRMAGG